MSSEMPSIIASVVDFFLSKKQLPAVAKVAWTSSKIVYSYVLEFREKSFNNKLYKFLKETEKTSDKDRINFLRRLGKNKQLFFQKTLMLLDRLEDDQKGKMVGKLCAALILKQITVDQYYRAALMIEKTYRPDIVNFHKTIKSIPNRMLDIKMPTDNTNKMDIWTSAGLYKKDNTFTEIGAVILKFAF